MKTKTFFLLCLFWGFGLTQIHAQSPKSIVLTFVSPYETGAECNGQVVDYLVGTARWHLVIHSWDGINLPKWCNYTVDGEAESNYTHELFKIKEIDKQDFILSSQVFHFNLIGDKGSHYILAATVDWSTGQTIQTTYKALCLENGRK
jgi:hypothetical protein